MTDASTSESMSPGLLRVAERARREPHARFHSLAHLIDVEALRRAFHAQDAQAAPGVDGVTKAQYGEQLETNLQDLHRRLRSKRWRHQPLRRVHIPKDGQGTRPIGISCFEDKLVQRALTEVLSAVFEQDFRDCSYGYRPGRSAHDALRELDRGAMQGEIRVILEADIQSFFDSLSRDRLREFLQARVPDGSITRLVGKCLNVGVLDGAEYHMPEEGTTQGSSLSPLLGNLYLHHVLDTWFEDEIRPQLRGRATLLRFADDFIIGFEDPQDAERVMQVLGKRMAKYGLTLQPEKTRLIPFARPPRSQQQGKGPGSFTFLGFTCHWGRSRAGTWVLRYKTSSSRLRRTVTRLHRWCRTHRHLKVREQHAGLVKRINGHLNYYGVNGNAESLARVVRQVERSWHKWLNRRSQRSRLNLERYRDMLRVYPLPRPRIRVRIWGAP